MIERLLNQPVSIVPRTGATLDQYSNETPTFGTPVAELGYLEQTAATEIIVDRETYTSEWLGFLRPGVTVGPADHLVFTGVTYEVLGPPHRVWNPRTADEHHVECHLRVVAG